MYKLVSYFATLLLLISFSSPSFALSMDEAKSKGLIGETSLGYLSSVKASPSSAVAALVTSINQQRKMAFTSKAVKAGVSVDVISKRVAQRLFAKAAKGNYLRNPAGKWYRK
jgi:uncharacterized protein YdbL (DUF1318 family)